MSLDFVHWMNIARHDTQPALLLCYTFLLPRLDTGTIKIESWNVLNVSNATDKKKQLKTCETDLYWSLRTIINIPFVEPKDSATIQLNVAFYSRLDGMCQNIECSLTFIISFLTKFTELQFGLESQNSNRELNWMKLLMLFLKFIFSWFYCDMRSTSD